MSNTTCRSLAELYADSRYSEFPREIRMGGSVPVEFVKAEQGAHDFVDPALPPLTLVVVLKSDIPFRWDLGDGFTDEQRMRTGDMNLCPPETQIAYECGGDHSILCAGFSAAHVAALLDEEGAQAGLEVFDPIHQSALFRDDAIRQAALRMWVEARDNSRASVLLIDGLFQMILGHLLRRAESEPKRSSWRLPPATLARIDDLIDACGETRLTTVDLAAAASMSQFQFTRSFKDTTGQTPHQYVLSRRIARAQDMLAHGTEGLAEIAYACGFSSQQHMTNVFTRKLGVSPGKYRRDIRG